MTTPENLTEQQCCELLGIALDAMLEIDFGGVPWRDSPRLRAVRDKACAALNAITSKVQP